MKKILALFLILFCSIVVSAQFYNLDVPTRKPQTQTKPKKQPKPQPQKVKIVEKEKLAKKEKTFEEKISKYDEVRSFHNGFAIVIKNKLCGLINKKGHEIISPEYDVISGWCENRILVFKNGKCGYLDYKGKQITEINYSSGTSYSEGFAIVTDKNVNEYYFIDLDGKIRFSKFDNAQVFRNGIAPVKRNNKTYFIDKYGVCISDFDNFFVDNCFFMVNKNSNNYRILLNNKYYFVSVENGKAYLSRDLDFNESYCKKF